MQAPIDQDMRRCITCNEVKTLDNFYADASRPKGRMYRCKPCHNLINPGGKPQYASPKVYDRNKWLFEKYGLTPEAYAERLFLQGGVCAICKKPDAQLGVLCVDHDHKTDAIRGLLCRTCNAGLGQFGDSLELLLAAVEYLRGASNER